MRNKILIGVVGILSLILIIISINVKQTYFSPLPVTKDELPITVRLLNEKDNTISTMNLEDYIVGVVAAEMPSSFESEALKAQAVASRSYAKYKMNSRKENNFDLIIGTKDQAFQTNEQLFKKWGLSFFSNFLKIRDAVKETKGEILTYQGNVIDAFFFSMSNGYTESSSKVFKEDLPYLQSVPSEWDNETIQNYIYTKILTKTDFCKGLNISCEQIDISNEHRSSANRVLSIDINGQTFTGVEVRTKLGLRSTDFTIVLSESEVSITTKGYGHGVGMSQYGANGMAKEGKTYQEILKYYYQNTEISKINV